MLLYLHKTKGHVWDTYTRVIPVQKSLFCIQNHTRGFGPIETINSGANQTVLNANTTDDVWN